MFEKNVWLGDKRASLELADGLFFRVSSEVLGLLVSILKLPNIIMKPIIIVPKQRVMILDPVLKLPEIQPEPINKWGTLHWPCQDWDSWTCWWQTSSPNCGYCSSSLKASAHRLLALW
jgi:hypothetical protein